MLLKEYKIIRPKGTKIQKKDNQRYVYHVLSVTYDRNKKYNTDKRVCIGRMVDNEYMIPNEKYELYYSDLNKIYKPIPQFSDTLKIGTFSLIRKVMDDLKLNEIIRNVHSDKFELINDIVSYIITDETSTFQYYPYVARNHNIISNTIHSDSYISKFLSEFSDEEVDLFIDAWCTINSGKENKIYINYDSTNMNCASEGISLLEYGHSKKQSDNPQVNVSYASLATDATPLFYEIYPGSINDTSQLKKMVSKAKSYGFNQVGLILDRGYYSLTNIADIEDSGFDLLMMIKDSNTMVELFKLEFFNAFIPKTKNFIDGYGVYGITINAKLSKKDKRNHYLHIYYDEQDASTKRKSFLENINYYKSNLISIIKSDDISQKHKNKLNKYDKYFNLKYVDDYLVSFSLKTSIIEKESKNFGYFALVSSIKMSNREALCTYRNRDAAEKLFRTLKTQMDMEAIRVYSDAALKAKVHLTFIASIVRNEIFNKTKDLKYKENGKIDSKSYTVPAIIKELENIEITKNHTGKYIRNYELTHKQKRILSKFNIDNDYIEKEVRRINNLLV